MATHLLQPDALVLPHCVAIGAVVEIEDGIIRRVLLDGQAEGDPVAGTLLPGLVDLQVNGGGGREVAEASVAALDEVAGAVGRGGAAAFLPTLTSCPFDELLARIDAVAAWIAGQRPTEGAAPLGIHVEGPFLRVPGTHDPACLIDPTPARVAALLDAGRGAVRLVTLSPSRQGAVQATAALRAAGVAVALGHDDAVDPVALLDGLSGCIAAGATMATHLFNAMGAGDHRAPGFAQWVMDAGHLAAGMVFDRVHVHPVLVRQAWRCLGPRRLLSTTDCTAALGMADGEYLLAGQPVLLQRGAVRDRQGRLAGAALGAGQALRNLLDILPEAGAWAAARIAATNPAGIIGAAHWGSIAPGGRARFFRLEAGQALRWPDGSGSGS